MSNNYMACFNAGVRLYCGNCKKSTLEPNMEMETVVNYNEANKYAYFIYNSMNDYSVCKSVICSHCGKIHSGTRENIKQIDNKTFSRFFSHAVVFDKDPDKVVLKVAYKHVQPYGQFLKIKMMEVRIVCNTATGYTYEFMPYYNGKKPKKPEGPRIKNISYQMGSSKINPQDIPEEVIKKYYHAILDKLKIRYGEDIKTLEQHYFEDMLRGKNNNRYTLMQVHFYNRFPYMNPETTKMLFNDDRFSYRQGRTDRRISIVDRGNPDPYNEIIKNFKLKNVNEDFIALLMKNTGYLYNYKLIQNVTDNYDKIISWIDDNHNNMVGLYGYRNERAIIKFFKHVKKKLGNDAEDFLLNATVYDFERGVERLDKFNDYGVEMPFHDNLTNTNYEADGKLQGLYNEEAAMRDSGFPGPTTFDPWEIF
ncbi:MAG TPA: hypothetical protein VK190_02570 [Pseudoneobacillus sp.]|nr:hypothetical protein [Pseudoneobacillus sp.]